MKLFAILIVCLASAWAFPNNGKLFTTIKELNLGKNRIISGQPAASGQFPWQVEVRLNTNAGQAFCGGSLIGNQWVLTAAHCTAGANSFELHLGTISSAANEGLIVKTSEYIRHKGYNDNLNNDLAVIKLPEPVTLNDNIRTIRLPNRGERVGAGESVTVSGWGKTSDASNSVSPVLNYVSLDTISNSDCASYYGSATIISSTLCAVGHPEHSSCNGDSGGPLVQYDANGVATHVGIVSFGSIAGCESGAPSGFVRTESYLDWIKEQTGLDV